MSEPSTRAGRPGPGSSVPARFVAGVRSYLGLLIVLVAVLVYFTATEPQFAKVDNFASVFSTSSPLLIVALALTFTMLAGGFDLSLSGIVVLSGILVAELTAHGVATPLVIVITVTAMTAYGALANGVPIAVYNLNFFVVTLATLSIAGGLALVIANGQNLVADTPLLETLGSHKLGPVPYPVVVAGGCFVVAVLIMRYTGFGRMIYAVGGNPEAARLAGIPVTSVRVATYAVGAGLGAIAGVLQTATLVSASSATDSTILLTAAAGVFLGGTSFSGGSGTMLGTLLGVAFLAILQNGLLISSVSSYWQGVVTGVILLASIGLDRVRRRARRSRPVPPPAPPAPPAAAQVVHRPGSGDPEQLPTHAGTAPDSPGRTPS